MGENTNVKTQKKDTQKKASFFKGVQAEFKRVIWPDGKTLGKQTAAVVVVSVILGAVIAVVDIIAQFGIDLLVK